MRSWLLAWPGLSNYSTLTCTEVPVIDERGAGFSILVRFYKSLNVLDGLV
jgi:hypothetical protein